MTPKGWDWCLAAPAMRDLERLPEKVATAVIESFDAIVKNPKRIGKPLRFQLEGLWSARRGPYRLIYAIDEQRGLVTIVAISHRSDAYRSS